MNISPLILNCCTTDYTNSPLNYNSDTNTELRNTTASTEKFADSTPNLNDLEYQNIDLQEFTDSFTDFGSVCEGTGSILIQVIPPSVSKNKEEPIYENPMMALWEAAERNKPDTIATLARTYRIDLNSSGINDYKALHISANEGHMESCQTLIALGANIDAKNYMDRTPLHLACIRGHLEVVRLLVKNGAEIDITDIDNNTPLHYAAEYGHLYVVSWILTLSPNLSIKNRLGKTPVELASSLEVSNILKEHQRDCAEIPRRSIQANDVRGESGAISPLDFEPLQLLGKGSFGEVYLVRKVQTTRFYAMKVLQKEKIIGQNLVKYAITERNVLSYIRHPFIVGLNYAFQTEQKLFLILDYCSGGDMAKLLQQERRFSEERARLYICEILLAIEELHKRDIIYRDLKPDNIVIDNEGHALLTDFGLSKEGINDNYTAKSFCGSIAYLTPEMIRRQGHGKAVDWYLLGVIFYEMIVGTPPYFSNNKEQLLFNIQRGKLQIPYTLSQEAKSLILSGSRQTSRLGPAGRRRYKRTPILPRSRLTDGRNAINPDAPCLQDQDNSTCNKLRRCLRNWKNA